MLLVRLTQTTELEQERDLVPAQMIALASGSFRLLTLPILLAGQPEMQIPRRGPAPRRATAEMPGLSQPPIEVEAVAARPVALMALEAMEVRRPLVVRAAQAAAVQMVVPMQRDHQAARLLRAATALEAQAAARLRARQAQPERAAAVLVQAQ